MARIRTIKPEFPQSESMGRVSRDARLLFLQLWTICDDSGRTRGNSRILASLLFPYDDDVLDLIDGWLEELEGEGCIVRYVVEGSTYLQVCNWLKHQKIDKPSTSKIPEFVESSRSLAKTLEHSSGDLGPRSRPNKNGDEYAADFLEFWDAWPNGFGSKGNKSEAAQAWSKVRNRPPLHDLISAVEAQHANKAAQQAAGEFVVPFKHVCRWLKLRGWESDESETVVSTGEFVL